MTNPVKLLSDDEVAEIEARPWMYPYLHNTEQRVLLRVGERDALCQTVRALRGRLDTLNTLGEEMLTRLEKVAGIGTKADHGWYFVVGEIERQNTALREQLDLVYQPTRQVLETCLDEGDPNPLLSKGGLHDLAYVVAQKLGELQSQSAQVTQERDEYRERLLKATETEVEI